MAINWNEVKHRYMWRDLDKIFNCISLLILDLFKNGLLENGHRVFDWHQ